MNITRRPVVALTVAASVLILAAGALLAVSWRNLPSEITLKVLDAGDAGEIGGKIELAGIFLTVCVLMAINLTLAETFFYRERFLSIALLALNLIFSVLAFAAVAFVISLN